MEFVLTPTQRPMNVPSTGVDKIRTLRTNGYNWIINSRFHGKSSVYRLDIHQPQARQCLLDIIHPVHKSPRPQLRQHLQSQTAARLNGASQTPNSQLTKIGNITHPKLEHAPETRQYSMDPPPRLKEETDSRNENITWISC
jgi:hypothetical protein